MRATGSGAGCGSHWPLCNGEVIPRSLRVETLIELGHRTSSGLLGIFVLALNVAVFRSRPRKHPARRAAVWTLFFVVAEALLGAGLVRFEWVAGNASVARVYVMAIHLVNTFLLLGAAALTAWFLGGDRGLQIRGRPGLLAPLALALGALLIVGSSGAVTALGDTLVLTQKLSPEDSPVVARLVASRFYHPTLAVGAVVLVAPLMSWLASRAAPASRSHARWLVALLAAQLALGGVNVLLRAPIAIQLAHLALSDAVWIVLVFLGAEALSRERSPLPEGA